MIVRMSIQDLHILSQHLTNAQTTIELLEPAVLALAHPVLYEHGMDVERGVFIAPFRHRSYSKGVIVDYTVVGFERNDKEWWMDRRCTMHLPTSQQKSSEGWNFDENGEDLKQRDDIEDVPTYKEDALMIKTLLQVQRDIRGHIDDSWVGK